MIEFKKYLKQTARFDKRLQVWVLINANNN